MLAVGTKHYKEIERLAVELTKIGRDIKEAHNNDLSIVKNFEPSDAASTAEVERALRMIGTRNETDLAHVSIFAQKYKAFERKKREAELIARPLVDYTLRDIELMLPPINNVSISKKLEEYIQYYRDTIESVDQKTFKFPIMEHGGYYTLLRPIGNDNSYASTGDNIKSEIKRAYDISDKSDFKEQIKSNLWGRLNDKRIRLVDDRLNAFEKIRAQAHDGLTELLRGPVVPGKFDYLIGLIETLKTASLETHAHCANIVVYAWDHIPRMKQVLSLRPDDFKIKIDNEQIIRPEPDHQRVLVFKAWTHIK